MARITIIHTTNDIGAGGGVRGLGEETGVDYLVHEEIEYRGEMAKEGGGGGREFLGREGFCLKTVSSFVGGGWLRFKWLVSPDLAIGLCHRGRLRFCVRLR